jgi:hypothetical protein
MTDDVPLCLRAALPADLPYLQRFTTMAVRDIREMVKAKVKGLIDDLAAQDSLISSR